MAEQLILPRRVIDANGDPLSGAKLYAYNEGTSTPETIYTDDTLATAHPSPLVSDAGGNFPPIWHAGDHGVKIAITDASDVALSWSPLDPCPATSSATNAANISFTPTTENPATNVQTAIENATTTGSPVSERSASFTVVSTDVGTVIRCTASITVSLTSALTLGNGFEVTIIADGGDVTIDPNGLETIDGAATKLIQDGKSAKIHGTLTEFYTSAFGTYTEEYHDPSNVLSWKIDGKTLTCWGQLTTDGSGSGSIAFPGTPAYSQNPIVVVTPFQASGIRHAQITSISTSSAGVFTNDGTSAAGTVNVHWHSKGKL
jgi:hypothetical protein